MFWSELTTNHIVEHDVVCGLGTRQMQVLKHAQCGMWSGNETNTSSQTCTMWCVVWERDKCKFSNIHNVVCSLGTRQTQVLKHARCGVWSGNETNTWCTLMGMSTIRAITETKLIKYPVRGVTANWHRYSSCFCEVHLTTGYLKFFNPHKQSPCIDIVMWSLSGSHELCIVTSSHLMVNHPPTHSF